MTRAKKTLLAVLAATLFTGIAVGAEMLGENDRMAYPDPTPTVAETFEGKALAEQDCPEPKATEASQDLSEVLTCDRHVVVK
jgi:hypothetical protein